MAFVGPKLLVLDSLSGLVVELQTCFSERSWTWSQSKCKPFIGILGQVVFSAVVFWPFPCFMPQSFNCCMDINDLPFLQSVLVFWRLDAAKKNLVDVCFWYYVTGFKHLSVFYAHYIVMCFDHSQCLIIYCWFVPQICLPLCFLCFQLFRFYY